MTDVLVNGRQFFLAIPSHVRQHTMALFIRYILTIRNSELNFSFLYVINTYISVSGKNYKFDPSSNSLT